MLSRSNHVVANGRISSFYGWKIFHDIIFYIHSSVNGCLGCFHVLAIINNAAVSIGVQISLGDSDLFSSDVYTDVGLLDHMVVLFLNFWGHSILFSIVAMSIYIPTNSAQGLPFLHIPLVFLMTAIPAGVSCYLIVVLVRISPVIIVVECWAPFHVPVPFPISHQDSCSNLLTLISCFCSSLFPQYGQSDLITNIPDFVTLLETSSDFLCT